MNYSNFFYRSKDYKSKIRDLESRSKLKMSKYSIFCNKEP